MIRQTMGVIAIAWLGVGCGRDQTDPGSEETTPLSAVGRTVIEEIIPVTDAELSVIGGVQPGCISDWRMVVRGSPIDHFRFVSRWIDMGLFIEQRFHYRNAEVGPFDAGPFEYCGESCAAVIYGHVNANYAPWCRNAEFIIPSTTALDGVVFDADSTFPLAFRLTMRGSSTCPAAGGSCSTLGTR